MLSSFNYCTTWSFYCCNCSLSDSNCFIYDLVVVISLRLSKDLLRLWDIFYCNTPVCSLYLGISSLTHFKSLEVFVTWVFICSTSFISYLFYTLSSLVNLWFSLISAAILWLVFSILLTIILALEIPLLLVLKFPMLVLCYTEDWWEVECSLKLKSDAKLGEGWSLYLTSALDGVRFMLPIGEDLPLLLFWTMCWLILL